MNDKDNYLKDLFEDFKYSVSKFDTQALTIGSGALGLSLTFIKEIVPFNQSICIVIFYISLSLFIISISLGFIGHYISIKQILKSIEIVSKEKYEDLKNDKWIPIINLIVVLTITLGILLLVLYCIINIHHRRNNDFNSKQSKKIELLKELNNGAKMIIEGNLDNFQYIDTTQNTTLKIK